MFDLHALDVSQLPTDHEVGAPLYRGPDGGLYMGALVDGSSRFAVTVPLPPGAVGTFHTHPGGIPEPSGQDLQSAEATGQEVLCVGVPETGQVVCRGIH